jgi:hypothetical protein
MSKTWNIGDTIKPADMQLGDTVEPKGNSMDFGTSIVRAIAGDSICLYRPYAHCDNFSCAYTHNAYSPYEEKGERVICYVGIEEYTINRQDDREYILHYRRTIK